jgi:hypothetical protein
MTFPAKPIGDFAPQRKNDCNILSCARRRSQHNDKSSDSWLVQATGIAPQPFFPENPCRSAQIACAKMLEMSVTKSDSF